MKRWGFPGLDVFHYRAVRSEPHFPSGVGTQVFYEDTGLQWNENTIASGMMRDEVCNKMRGRLGGSGNYR